MVHSDCTLLLQPFFKSLKYVDGFYGLFTKKTINKRKAPYSVPSVGTDTNNKTIFQVICKFRLKMLVIFYSHGADNYTV
jgi:hypothetical protein